MITDLFRAEWVKIAGNRWASAFLIGIFPVGAALFVILNILLALLSDNFRLQMQFEGFDPWYVVMVDVWNIVNNVVGRWIIIVFAAFVFAGEYAHGTWKNLVTRRSRVTLILNKFFTLAVFVTSAFVLTSLIAGIGLGIVASILDVDYGLSETGEVLGDFLRDYVVQAFTTLAGTIISASFAALAAMIARNILVASMVGIFFYMLEFAAILIIFGLINWIFEIDLSPVYRLLPSFNLDSITAWVVTGEARIVPVLGSNLEAFSLGVSVLIVVAWVVALVGLTTALFYRQDITT
jgi:hypothetical protein